MQCGIRLVVSACVRSLTPCLLGMNKLCPALPCSACPPTCLPAGGALLAIDQGFMGPNYSISTACATANYAFVSGERGQGKVEREGWVLEAKVNPD